MSNNLSIKDFETMNEFVLVSFSDNTESIISLDDLRKNCPCADCAGETDALGNIYKGLCICYQERRFHQRNQRRGSFYVNHLRRLWIQCYRRMKPEQIHSSFQNLLWINCWTLQYEFENFI